ncbi:hypothetical protein D3C86_1823870 [compost metagenome]
MRSAASAASHATPCASAAPSTASRLLTLNLPIIGVVTSALPKLPSRWKAVPLAVARTPEARSHWPRAAEAPAAPSIPYSITCGAVTAAALPASRRRPMASSRLITAARRPSHWNRRALAASYSAMVPW